MTWRRGSRLSPAEWEALADRYRAGEPLGVLARGHGVSAQYVSAHLRGMGLPARKRHATWAARRPEAPRWVRCPRCGGRAPAAGHPACAARGAW